MFLYVRNLPYAWHHYLHTLDFEPFGIPRQSWPMWCAALVLAQIFAMRREVRCKVPLVPGACTGGRSVAAALYIPETPPSFAIVCTHPWAMIGGSMDDHVVVTVHGLHYINIKSAQ